MGEEAVCDYPGCGAVGEIIFGFPEGYLVATGKKAYFSEKHIAVSIIVQTTMKS